ncbi:MULTISPECIES: hypothetical protein [Pseudomonas syringae group]|uniref:hypothetical protein n=1 Tax=Pseudomonas syringae group TaxID=136849 RepID=UPI000F0096E8|nr:MULTISPECIES: hypothetical protein [Pseudomonas syringae group]MCH5536883.1 hypothetical protein [Pseudomonas syringae pv. syringae]MDU8608743.1 hypothetical protein [Pseudomonas syringae group sp. 247E2]RMU57745.1 hypothetical protein ALP27_02627 [Pseudomonas savastanoi pv. glycinea]RMW21072.1 hypothetical protein ALO96_00919 [Pseudomonas savastanoi pv. glycinea]
MPDFQLYHTGMKLEMPSSVIYSRNKQAPTVRKRMLSKQVYMFWPNGSPCTLVNIWLQQISTKATGSSAETFAIHMTHYIRYCFNRGADLLTADDIFLSDFAKHLLEEKKLKHSALADARSPNHVAYTIRRVIDFFIWYQMHYRLISQPKIIGELGTGAQVNITWKVSMRGQPILCHPAIPTERPPVGDKKPMPDDFIGKICDTILMLKTKPRYPFGVSAAPRHNDYVTKNEYLYSRRLATVKLSKMTGLRPDELNNIPFDLNQRPIETRTLYIPTLKTRRLPRPIREFPLSLEDAIEVSVYLKARSDFLAYLNLESSAANSFLLAQDGTPIETRSLARDFKRLCDLSGLADVQVCLSMFRHRFITTQIAYEIARELQRDLPQKDLWQEAVQRRILAKVAKLTGHLDPMSLKHYFDEAFAIAIASSATKSSQKTKALILQLQTTILELSQNPAVYSDPNIAKGVCELELIISQLKNR